MSLSVSLDRLCRFVVLVVGTSTLLLAPLQAQTAPNQSMAGNLQGMGMLGNPALVNMQAQGLGMGAPGMGMGMGMRMGMDPTAGAAAFLVQQALLSDTGMSGAPGQGPSFDAALAEALE